MNIFNRSRFGLLAAMSLVGGLLGTGLPHPAFADLIYTLNYDSCSGGCGNGQGTSNNNFGTVDLAQVNSTTVSVTVTLSEGVGLDTDFVNTGNGSNHPIFAINVASPPAPVTIVASSINGGSCSGGPCFAVGPSPDTTSDLGTFTNSIVCTSNCPNGGSGADDLGGTLVFSTTDGSALSINDFIANSSGFIFAADVIGPSGKTGLIGANGTPTTTVPEPASLVIFGTALASLGLIRRRRNSV